MNKPSMPTRAPSTHRRKRLRLPWQLTKHQMPASGHLVWARDPTWLCADGRVREGVNARYDSGGRHSHWRWGNPAMWKRLTPSQLTAQQSRPDQL